MTEAFSLCIPKGQSEILISAVKGRLLSFFSFFQTPGVFRFFFFAYDCITKVTESCGVTFAITRKQRRIAVCMYLRMLFDMQSFIHTRLAPYYCMVTYSKRVTLVHTECITQCKVLAGSHAAGSRLVKRTAIADYTYTHIRVPSIV